MYLSIYDSRNWLFMLIERVKGGEIKEEVGRNQGVKRGEIKEEVGRNQGEKGENNILKSPYL